MPENINSVKLNTGQIHPQSIFANLQSDLLLRFLCRWKQITFFLCRV